jgi:hypothetical protein
MEDIITAAGRRPRQRTTLYGVPPRSQTERSLAADLPPLAVAVGLGGGGGAGVAVGVE